MVPSVVRLQSDLCSICWTVKFELLQVVWTILDLEQEFWIIWETKVFTFHTFIQARFWDIIMQILDGFFRVKPENIGFATCMKNIGLRFASSDIFHTCRSSNIFRYHPQAIQYCIKLGMWVVGPQVLPMWSVVTECAYLIPHLHICSDWLITKKSNI